MPSFSNFSLSHLETCDDRLQDVFNEVIKHVDCRVFSGHRSPEEQDRLFEEGKTTLIGGESKHNKFPSLAIDVTPYPIDWENRERMLLFNGFVLGTASQMGVILRSGSDWNMNFNPRDQTFHDLPHFELL